MISWSWSTISARFAYRQAPLWMRKTAHRIRRSASAYGPQGRDLGCPACIRGKACQIFGITAKASVAIGCQSEVSFLDQGLDGIVVRRFDRQFDADFSEVCLKELCQRLVAVRNEKLVGHRWPPYSMTPSPSLSAARLLPSGFSPSLHQVHSSLHPDLVGLRMDIANASRKAGSIIGLIHNLLTVNGICHRLTHLFISQRRSIKVKVETAYPKALSLKHRDIFCPFKALGLLVAGGGSDVNIPVEERRPGSS